VRFVVLLLAVALVLAPGAEARHGHGKHKKRQSVSVRFKAKKDKHPRRERLKRGRVRHTPRFYDRVPLGPPVVVPAPPKPPPAVAYDIVCVGYFTADGEMVQDCHGGNGWNQCVIISADHTSSRPCPEVPPPPGNPPPPVPPQP